MKRHETHVDYDHEADAAYVYVTEIGPGEAVEQVICEDERLPTGDVIVDLDNEGRILGFEVLAASRALPTKLLDELR
jgi:uncharacterized protein YuzE